MHGTPKQLSDNNRPDVHEVLISLGLLDENMYTDLVIEAFPALDDQLQCIYMIICDAFPSHPIDFKDVCTAEVRDAYYNQMNKRISDDEIVRFLVKA